MKNPLGYEYTALFIRAHIHKDLSTQKELLEKNLFEDVNSLVKKNIVLGELEKVTSNDVELIYDIRLNFAAAKLVDIEIQDVLSRIKSWNYISHAFIREVNKE